uniref:Ion transport domain-containing protein n=1 Tax=Attheya septentrionalis TaxID=420275 RepID=A0A7S2UNT3_9STRA|mmetsp:Transcript_3943/g.7094  ORF Transcript_3943/g.7094 Transcript_3943/m.7094 type:complete len:544 (+) Transcript_3943:1-1632(+)
MISSPFAVAVVFFDALFLSLLLLSFRVSINGYLNGMDPKVVFTWIYIANACIFYFVIRELGKAISLSMITRGAFFQSYFWSFWNIVDILATGLALGSTTAMRLNLDTDVSASSDLLRALLAITTGLLWLRVLGLLKTVNMQLATFVLATVQITRDILWFLLILLTAVVAFSQMFYTLLLPSGCSTGETAAEHCNQAEYYLRVYSILLGDFGEFDRSDFSTVLSVTLAVFFTFMVVLVLLNVLIAIVSDSYEKCLVRSHFLFGRARVMLLAELVSFQNLLRTNSGADLETRDLPNRKWIRKTWKNGWTRGSVVFYCCSGLVLIAWMMGEIAGHLSGERYGNIRISICSIVVNVLLLIAILIFLTKGAADEDVKSEKNNGPKRFWTRWYEKLIQKAMLRLLGASKHNSSLSRVEENDEWRGRAQYLQKEMTRISAENLASTRIYVRGLENQIKHADSRTNAEIVALEEKVRNVEDSIKTELMETEKRIQQMIEQSVNQMRDLLQSERPTALSGTRDKPVDTAAMIDGDKKVRVGRPRPHYSSIRR